MSNRYWVGGTGTWNTTNTTNWSTTSGGAGPASVPGTADVAIFDANSGTGTCTISNPGNVGGLTTTGYTGTLSGGVRVQSGNVVIGSTGSQGGLGITHIGNGSFSVSLGQTITSYNARIGNTITPGATLTVNSNLTCSSFIRLSSFSTSTSVNINASGRTLTAPNVQVDVGNGNTISHGSVTGAYSATIGSGASSSITASGTLNANGGSVSISNSNAGAFSGFASLTNIGSLTVNNSGSGSITLPGSTLTVASSVSITRTSGTLTVPTTYVASSPSNISVTGLSVSVGATSLSTGCSISIGNGSMSLTLPAVSQSSVVTLTQNSGGSFNLINWDNSSSSNGVPTLQLNTDVASSSLVLIGRLPTASGYLQVTGSGARRKLNANNYNLSNIYWFNIDADGFVPFSGTGFTDGGSNLDIAFPSAGNGLLFGSNF